MEKLNATGKTLVVVTEDSNEDNPTPIYDEVDLNKELEMIQNKNYIVNKLIK